MSVRLTAVDSYNAGTGLPTANILTVTFWLYISVDRNAFSTIFKITDSGSVNVAFLSTLGDGTTLVTIDNTGAQGGNTPVALTVGTWYRVGLVVNGNTTTLYTGGDTGSLTSSTGTTASNTVPFFNTFGSSLNGRLAALKVWNATLNATEVAAELGSFDAVRATNLLRVHPFHVAETTDYSGNGNTLTVSGTGAGISTEDDPPIIPPVVDPIRLPIQTIQIP